MKTTIEISDTIFRQVKARTSLKGQTMKSFFLEAIMDKLNKERNADTEKAGWQKVFGKGSQSSIAEVQDIIDDEFSKIDQEEWK